MGQPRPLKLYLNMIKINSILPFTPLHGNKFVKGKTTFQTCEDLKKKLKVLDISPLMNSNFVTLILEWNSFGIYSSLLCINLAKLMFVVLFLCTIFFILGLFLA